ncbi:TPA: hypothetical protein EYG96_02720 [Candidatus Gracilibacteria bacterium]|nr:hypothetical protein [Candidatus Peregrinibacteria bacterium]HIQ56927.1 hypothetical protein [Candidatus Gracilibacteria bacterium]HIQ57595.1 hypothetical protein [Candidatus Gracilibacteria bacterium]
MKAVQTTTVTQTTTLNKKIKKTVLTIKEKFQRKYGLYEDKNHFIVFIATPLFDENNSNLWADLLPGLSDMGFQIVIRGNASEKNKEIAMAFAEDHSALCTIIDEDEYLEAYEVSDILLTFSQDKSTILEVQHALSKGVIPIIAHDFPLDILENYNPNLENGNSFMYYKQTPWSIFATIIRAYENYRFPYDWRNLCKSAIKSSKQ